MINQKLPNSIIYEYMNIWQRIFIFVLPVIRSSVVPIDASFLSFSRSVSIFTVFTISRLSISLCICILSFIPNTPTIESPSWITLSTKYNEIYGTVILSNFVGMNFKALLANDTFWIGINLPTLTLYSMDHAFTLLHVYAVWSVTEIA